jgi:hypothetical protein
LHLKYETWFQAFAFQINLYRRYNMAPNTPSTPAEAAACAAGLAHYLSQSRAADDTARARIPILDAHVADLKRQLRDAVEARKREEGEKVEQTHRRRALDVDLALVAARETQLEQANNTLRERLNEAELNLRTTLQENLDAAKKHSEKTRRAEVGLYSC